MSDKQTYEGRVIAFREDNGYDDSDFYALVETDEGGFAWIGTGSTRCGGGWVATPNATDEVKARYAAWYAKKYEWAMTEQAAYEETLVKVGSTVRVDGGRKYTGRTGTVTWYGEDKYRSSSLVTQYRAKVQTVTGESFFVPASYLMVLTSTGEYAYPGNAASGQMPAGTSAAVWVLAQYPAPRTVAA